MGARMPVSRDVRWLMALPPLGALGVLFALAGLLMGWDMPALLGAAVVWLAYTLTARQVWLRHHRAGMKALQARRWDEAIECYRRGEALFREQPWIDRWRSLTLMTASGMSFTEIAVNNIGFSQLQNGDAVEARQTFERGLAEFPDSFLLRNALHTMDMGAAAEAARRGVRSECAE